MPATTSGAGPRGRRRGTCPHLGYPAARTHTCPYQTNSSVAPKQAATGSRGHASRRVRGVLLLDALYGNEADFSHWVSRERRHAFFVSAYSADTRAANDRLAALLEVAEVPHRRVLPPQLTAGTASVVDLGSAADHAGFANRAWTDDPITDALRRAGAPAATLSPSLRNCWNRHPTIPPR